MSNAKLWSRNVGFAAWLSSSRPRGVREQKRRAEKPEGVAGVFRLGQAGRERHTSHDRKGSTSRERGRGQREELESGSRSASGIGDRRRKGERPRETRARPRMGLARNARADEPCLWGMHSRAGRARDRYTQCLCSLRTADVACRVHVHAGVVRLSLGLGR